jgi:hypothetical protein
VGAKRLASDGGGLSMRERLITAAARTSPVSSVSSPWQRLCDDAQLNLLRDTAIEVVSAIACRDKPRADCETYQDCDATQ